MRLNLYFLVNRIIINLKNATQKIQKKSVNTNEHNASDSGKSKDLWQANSATSY